MQYLEPLVGGMIIGLSALALLIFNGKILGISGILGGILQKGGESKSWRYFFLLGIISGGFLILAVHPQALTFSLNRSHFAILIAGLLVGYGTHLANGCTSGHGVCGISRFSKRSIIATLTFMFFGAATVFIINHLLGGII